MTNLSNYKEKNQLFSQKQNDLANALKQHTQAVDAIGRVGTILSVLLRVSDNRTYVFPQDEPVYTKAVTEQIERLNAAVKEYNKIALYIRAQPILLPLPFRNGDLRIIEFPNLFDTFN